MDFLTTLSTFGTILGIVTVLATFLDYMLNHNSANPNRARNLRFTTFLSAIALGAILFVQYVSFPATSIFTLMGAPFTGSTLHANDCHMTVSKLPYTPTTSSVPVPKSGIASYGFDMSGSSVLYGLMSQAAQQFQTVNGTTITVGKLDSGQGLHNVATGVSQVGLSDMYQGESTDQTVQNTPGLTDYQIAAAPMTLVVSDDLSGVVDNLTTQQIVGIFTGHITNWRQIGGPDELITVVNRPQGSGTRLTFEKYVLGSSIPQEDYRARTTSGLLSTLSATKGSIGYAGTGAIVTAPKTLLKVHPICIDGYGATTGDIQSGKYLFWSYEHMYVQTAKPPTAWPAIQSFIAYVCSKSFQQQDLRSNGLLSMGYVGGTKYESQLNDTAVQNHEEDYPRPVRCTDLK